MIKHVDISLSNNNRDAIDQEMDSTGDGFSND
jgi:hypothetical protein